MTKQLTLKLYKIVSDDDLSLQGFESVLANLCQIEKLIDARCQKILIDWLSLFMKLSCPICRVVLRESPERFFVTSQNSLILELGTLKGRSTGVVKQARRRRENIF